MYLLDDGNEVEEQRSPLAVRIAILGGLAIFMFSVIFFRLWYLQVLSGDRISPGRRTTSCARYASRGRAARSSTARATCWSATARPRARGAPRRPPRGPATRREELAHPRPGRGARSVRHPQDPREPGPECHRRQGDHQARARARRVYYLREHQASFPGVEVDRVFVRPYPDGPWPRSSSALRARSPRSSSALALLGAPAGRRGRPVRASSTTTTATCAGGIGDTKIQIDASGRPTGNPQVTPAEPGDNLRLTIDPSVRGDGPGGDRLVRAARRLRRDGRPQRRVIGLGSTPDLRPIGVHQADHQGALQGADLGEHRRAALRPRDLRRLSDRLDLQADHRDGGAPGRAARRRRPRSSTAARSRSDVQTFHNAGDAVYGTLDLTNALQVSSDVFFYTLGLKAPAKGNGGLIQDWARQLGLGAQTGIDLPGEAPGLMPDAGLAQPSSIAGEARPTGPGRWATTSTSRSARATSRPTRCRWRSPTPRSPTAATSSRPHVGMRVDDPPGRVIQEIDPPATRHVDIDPATAGDPRRPARRGDRARRHLLSGVRRLPGRRSPARPAPPSAPASPTSPGTSRWRPYHEPEDRRRRDGRAGWLRRRLGGAGRPADPRRATSHVKAGCVRGERRR